MAPWEPFSSKPPSCIQYIVLLFNWSYDCFSFNFSSMENHMDFFNAQLNQSCSLVTHFSESDPAASTALNMDACHLSRERPVLLFEWKPSFDTQDCKCPHIQPVSVGFLMYCFFSIQDHRLDVQCLDIYSYS